MEAIIFIIVAIMIGSVCGSIAEHKGRSKRGWFWLGFFFTIIALICIALLPPRKQEKPQNQYHYHYHQLPDAQPYQQPQRDGSVIDNQPLQLNSTSDTKECPYCAETIKRRAIKCRYCGSELDDVIEHGIKEERLPATNPAWCKSSDMSENRICIYCRNIIKKEYMSCPICHKQL